MSCPVAGLGIATWEYRFKTTVRQVARSRQVFVVTSCPGCSAFRISPGQGGRRDALSLACGYRFRDVGTRRP